MHTPGGCPTSRQAWNLVDGLPQLRTAHEAKQQLLPLQRREGMSVQISNSLSQGGEKERVGAGS